MIPCVGAGITLIDPGRREVDKHGRRLPINRLSRRYSRSSRSSKIRFLRVYVTGHDTWTTGFGWRISWKSGKREGGVFESDEGKTWFQGHGPQARAAFEVARALT